jgi:hypothetical protein
MHPNFIENYYLNIMYWLSLVVSSSSREQIEFWYFFSFCPQKGRDLDQPISRHLYTVNVLSFYDVSRMRKILMIFDQILWSKVVGVEKFESIISFSKFPSLIFLDILSIPIPTTTNTSQYQYPQYQMVLVLLHPGIILD